MFEPITVAHRFARSRSPAAMASFRTSPSTGLTATPSSSLVAPPGVGSIVRAGADRLPARRRIDTLPNGDRDGRAGHRRGITNREQSNGTYAVNSVGELPGTDPSKTYLVLAHYDTINVVGGTAAPGADDNASGIAAMLEIARALSGYRPPCAVHFLAATGEKEAMQGANAFADAVTQDGTTYAGAFNLDSLGWTGRTNQLVVNGGAGTAGLQELMVSINTVFGLGQDLVIRQNPTIVADDNPLRDAEIPAVLIARALYGENPVHHTGDDTIDLVDIAPVRLAAELVLLTIGELETR